MITRRYLMSCLLLTALPGGASLPHPRPIFSFLYKDSSYVTLRGKTNFHTAKSYCINKGSQLVTIESQEENDFIHQYISRRTVRDYFLWIGLQLISADWVWSIPTNPPLANGYHNWDTAYNQPDGSGHCGAISTMNGKWWSMPCNDSRVVGYICKSRESSPTASTSGSVNSTWNLTASTTRSVISTWTPAASNTWKVTSSWSPTAGATVVDATALELVTSTDYSRKEGASLALVVYWVLVGILGFTTTTALVYIVILKRNQKGKKQTEASERPESSYDCVTRQTNMPLDSPVYSTVNCPVSQHNYEALVTISEPGSQCNYETLVPNREPRTNTYYVFSNAN